MDQFKQLMIIIALFAFALSGTALGEELSYYSDGQKIQLEKDDGFVLVKYKKLPLTFKSNAEDRQILKNNMTIEKFTQSSMRESLDRSSDVLYTSQMFRVGDVRMAPTNEIIVKFNPTVTKETIETINASFGSTVKEILLDGSYLLEVRAFRGEEAMAIARSYYLLDETIYAHPNFVRQMRLMPQGPENDTESLDDPLDGRRSQESNNASPGFGPLKAGDVQVTEVFKDKFSSLSVDDNWNVYLGAGARDAYWGKTKYKRKSTPYSAFCAVDGTEGTRPSRTYPNDMNAWMVLDAAQYIPGGANYAEVKFKSWVKSESGYDYFKYLVSVDGTTFYGTQLTGKWKWRYPKIDLTDVYALGNVVNNPNLTIAFVFQSDNIVGINKGGAYVDDVIINVFTDPLVALSNDPYSSRQWALNNIGQNGGKENADMDVPEAWALGADGTGITVAVIDEGVDLTHPDLNDNLVAGFDAVAALSGTDTAGGYQPGSDDAHGTGCAGIIAAEQGNSIGTTGVAYNANILPVRIAYGDGAGGWLTTDAAIANGINWAWQNGADVLSNSWGGGGSSDAITNSIKAAKVNGRGGLGCLILFASGNNNSKVSYPAKLRHVLAIGASSPSDKRKSPKSCDGEFWWGSNYNKNLDLMAPGVKIPTTDIQGDLGYEDTTSAPTHPDYTMSFNGTSSACPNAAGVAALVLDINPALTRKQVISILKKSTDKIGTSSQTGSGRVNARKAVERAINSL